MTKLSIIVPVYNVEKYIRPCIESIFKQGLDDNDFEVIIVNDGTPDHSMEMIEDIIQQHNNITVINQENLSLSVARNNGIAAAKGEYILMPDSDDLLIENSLKPLLEKALETKADLVVADFLKMTNEEIDSLTTIPQNDFVFQEKTGEKPFLEVLNPNYCYVWRTLYRKEFLTSKNISFVPHLKYEDILFTHECYLKARCCIKTNIVLYIYRRRLGSLTNAYTIDNSRNSTVIESEIENFLETNEGQNIKADIQLLNDMGFDKKMINKVYILLRPENIERAIDYMSEIDGIYQHNFVPSSNPKEKLLCFICKKTKHFHLDYIPNDLLNENNNNNIELKIIMKENVKFVMKN